MSLLVESIRVEDGVPVNIHFHNERMVRTIKNLFNINKKTDLLNILDVPSDARKGIFKCRVEYDQAIRKIEFLPYKIKAVNTLKLVECNDISYSYKFADRKKIDSLFEKRGASDDILIIKEGLVTDSSYANVVLKDLNGKWITPFTCLLAGTRRASLLKSGLIKENEVRVNDLHNYTLIKIINAMIGIEDTEGIPIENIYSDLR
jgi:4-amino-4-deoxychorismate lyase